MLSPQRQSVSSLQDLAQQELFETHEIKSLAVLGKAHLVPAINKIKSNRGPFSPERHQLNLCCSPELWGFTLEEKSLRETKPGEGSEMLRVSGFPNAKLAALAAEILFPELPPPTPLTQESTDLRKYPFAIIRKGLRVTCTKSPSTSEVTKIEVWSFWSQNNSRSLCSLSDYQFGMLDKCLRCLKLDSENEKSKTYIVETAPSEFVLRNARKEALHNLAAGKSQQPEITY